MPPAKDPNSFLPLSPQAFQILLSLLQEAQHPYAILKDVEHRTRGEMILGTSTVYSAMKRMVREGLIREAHALPDRSSGGPKRRYYEITELGYDVARAEGLRVARLHQTVRESALLRKGPASQEAGS